MKLRSKNSNSYLFVNLTSLNLPPVSNQTNFKQKQIITSSKYALKLIYFFKSKKATILYLKNSNEIVSCLVFKQHTNPKNLLCLSSASNFQKNKLRLPHLILVEDSMATVCLGALKQQKLPTIILNSNNPISLEKLIDGNFFKLHFTASRLLLLLTFFILKKN